MTFKDHFSFQAAEYARFRPRYPDELFEYLAGRAPARTVVWDCATGNGQAALSLARFFDQVIATDASETQIRNAPSHPRIDYRVAPAENSELESNSVDLITVAQALHWFDLTAFYGEAKRVLKSGGLLAAWGYNLLQITPQVDAVVHRFYDEIVGPFWPPERQLIERGYGCLAFPFNELDAPRFRMNASWSLDQLLGYLRTWSATHRFIASNRHDPVELIAGDLRAAWGPPEKQQLMVWPLAIRVGVWSR